MISLAVVNLVTPKAGAKHEHLLNKPPQPLLTEVLSSMKLMSQTKGIK
jgi:hypothetical protein